MTNVTTNSSVEQRSKAFRFVCAGDPYFRRKLRFTSALDNVGRVRFALLQRPA
ncbi:hypothetical protein PAPYRUS_3 [Mycobacterium phage Papyrus]|uniref:Uncharacterized protein n=1 Tax=Mycobacterium phage Papyrus TaxID=1383056 RepID=S5YR42_9CAUD|nr:hypothetical protein N842_gp003 [Mycobacterium phage Papyrus]AGT14013.1 hypothetical protein PAPYRUS_3 [Mycobacterium phage Papyrus]